jgi:DNA-binding NarL/FixJ family response regulator
MAELKSPRKEIQVLLVDDQDDVLESLKLFLETEPGLSVVGLAKDGFEALEKVRKLSPQVVIMDVKMPRMNGLEATRRLKSLYPKINVILLSMYNNPELMQEGKEAGANSYFLKGTTTLDLINKIKMLC